MIISFFAQASSRMTGSKSNLRSSVADHADVIMRDDDDDEQERFRDRQAATSAREEERRKVLEIEEERIRLEREAQLRRNGGAGGRLDTMGRGGGCWSMTTFFPCSL